MLGFVSPGVDGGTRHGGSSSCPGPVHLTWDGTSWPLPPSVICVLRNHGIGFLAQLSLPGQQPPYPQLRRGGWAPSLTLSSGRRTLS